MASTNGNVDHQVVTTEDQPNLKINRHNSIFCFTNEAFEDDDEVYGDDGDDVYQDALPGGEDEEYMFEPALRFKVSKRNSSIVTFFRSIDPRARKTVTISDPEVNGNLEDQEVDSRRRKSSTTFPLPPPPSPSSPKVHPPSLFSFKGEDEGKRSFKDSKVHDHKGWIPFFSLFRYANNWDTFLVAFGFLITFLATWPIPALNLIYGQFVNNLVHYEGTYHHKNELNSTLKSKNFGAQSRGRLPFMDDFCDWKVVEKDYLFPFNSTSNTTSLDSSSYEHDYLLCQVYFLSGTLLAIASWFIFSTYLSMLVFELSAFNQSLTIRRRLFRSLLRQDIAWFDEQTTYDVMAGSNSTGSGSSNQEGGKGGEPKSNKIKSTEFSTRVAKDLKAIEGGMNENLSMLSYFVFSCFWNASFALYFGWKLALAIFITSAPIIAIATGVMSKFNTSAVRKEMKAYGEAGAVAAEMFSSVRTVFAFGGEGKALQMYELRLMPAVRSETRRSVINSLGNALIWAGIYFGFAVGIWYGVKLMIDGSSEGIGLDFEDQEASEFSVGTIIVVFWCSAAVGWNAGSAAPYYEKILKACVVAKSIYETIEAKPKIHTTVPLIKKKKTDTKNPKNKRRKSSTQLRRHLPSTYTPTIEFRNVTFTYPARRGKDTSSVDGQGEARPTLESFSLTIAAGEVVALVGPSGAGKSTVVQLLLRFYDPDAGAVFLGGVDIRSLDVGWLREQFGVVGQEPVLFDASIGDNIRLGAASGRLMSVKESEVVSAAKEANAHEFIMRLPEGYNTMVGVRGAKLSGGQKQRIAIARALLKNPAILALDEATSALDFKSEALVQGALDRASRGRTTIIVAHRLSTIANADRIVVLDKGGRILEVGSHEELMNSKEGHFCQLVMRQIVNTSSSSSSTSSTLKSERKGVPEVHQTLIEENLLEEEEISKIPDEAGFVDIPLRTLSIDKGTTKQKIKGLSPNISDDKNGTSSTYSTVKVMLRILGLLCQSRVIVTLGITCACLFGLCVPIYAFIFGNFVNVFTNSSEEVGSTMSTLTTLPPLPLAEEIVSSFGSTVGGLLEGFNGSNYHLLPQKRARGPSNISTSPPSNTSPNHSTTYGIEDDYLRDQARNYAFQFLALAIFAFLSAFLQNSFFCIASQRLVTALRLLAFRSMLAKPVSWHEKPEHGASRLCTTLANDPSDIQSSTGPRIAMLCQAGSALLVTVAFGLWTCWSLCLVALAFVPLIALSSSSRVEIFGEQNTKEAERNAEAAAVGSEALANIRTVASLHREAFFERYYAALLGTNVGTIRWQIHKKSLHIAWALGCPLVAYATVFLYGGHLVANHDLSTGDFLRVIEAMIFGAIVFGQACFFSSDFAKAKMSATALFELIDSQKEGSRLPLPPPPCARPPSELQLSPNSPPLSPPSSGMTLHLQYGRCRGEIAFRRVCFSYPSRPSVAVLREVTFHVKAGQKVALVGASGGGKTTVFQLLERFYEPTSGVILLDGVSTANLAVSWLRAQMALVAQEPTLFNTSIRENIAYGDTSRSNIPLAEIIEAAKKAAIHEWIASQPAAYETVVGLGGCQLSGGQKQRIAIARTWIRNPAVLLMDEATSALDSNSEKEIQSTLEAALVGRTVLTIAHRLSTIANSDLILYLHQGSIAEAGSHEELLARKGHYWQLYNHQLSAMQGTSRNTSKVDLAALQKTSEKEKEVQEVIRMVEREFRV